jgi:hypothetical protein
MFRYRELSEPTRSEEAYGEWANFPASSNWREANRVPHRQAKTGGSLMMTFVAIALRGLLVTTTAVAIVAYLLLTNSHI